MLERALQEHRQAPHIAVIMGVSGSGKTTIGRVLARRLGWLFLEGDALRSEEHTSELQSQSNLGCRLLPEKKTTSGLKDGAVDQAALPRSIRRCPISRPG